MIQMLYFERERNWWRLTWIFSKNLELQCYDLVKKPTRSDFSTMQPQLEYIDYVPIPIDHIAKRSQLTATTVCSMLIRLAMQGQVQCGPRGGSSARQNRSSKDQPNSREVMTVYRALSCKIASLVTK
jgi:hypothetical protein